jgi:antitoxin component of RelBE/YafQ-DinJ toxin-antitoxin module
MMGVMIFCSIRIYLKKIVLSRGIPFSLEAKRGVMADLVEVDGETQAKMDSIAQSWKQVSR